jgi:hypothetical protein
MLKIKTYYLVNKSAGIRDSNKKKHFFQWKPPKFYSQNISRIKPPNAMFSFKIIPH